MLSLQDDLKSILENSHLAPAFAIQRLSIEVAKLNERIAELEEELDEAHHNLELAVDVGNAKAAHAHFEGTTTA